VIDKTVKAAIVGAGPAGAAVSEILSRAGIAHDLYDEQPRAGGNIGRRRFDAPPLALEGAQTRAAPEGARHCTYRASRRDRCSGARPRARATAPIAPRRACCRFRPSAC